MPDVSFPAPAIVQNALVPGAMVAGYRLLRQIPGAAGIITWLAQGPGEEETVCISVQSVTESVDRRIAAHSRISSPHVLALADLATDADGQVVLACERTDWTLATLLSARGRLAPGEAVTILAPLVAGLAAIHSEGLCHGGLTTACVLFDPHGRPVLGGLDTVRESEAEPDAGVLPPRIRADCRALGDLIVAVATVIDGSARSQFAEISDWLESESERDSVTTGHALLRQLECRIFAVAPALPVVLAAGRRPSDGSVSGHRRPGGGINPAGVSVRSSMGALPALTRILAAVERSGVGPWAKRVLRGRAFIVCLGLVLLIAALLAGLTAIPDQGPGADGVVLLAMSATTEKRQPVCVLEDEDEHRLAFT